MARAAHELTLAHLTAIELAPPELVRAAASAGFDAVTLRVFPPRLDGPPVPLASDVRLRDETLSALRTDGMGVLDVEALVLDETFELDDLAPGIEVAAALEARHLLVVGADRNHARLAARLHELCVRSEPLGIRPMLEFIPFSSVATLEQAVAIVDAAAHPAAGVLVDPLHLRRSGGSPAQVAELARSTPERFPYVQLCDAPLAAPDGGTRGLYREAVTARLLPGDGQLPLRELLNALPPGLALSVEIPTCALGEVCGAERIDRIGRSVRAWLASAPGR
jgi:sugar phosphate isomerase/epimerase